VVIGLSSQLQSKILVNSPTLKSRWSLNIMSTFFLGKPSYFYRLTSLLLPEPILLPGELINQMISNGFE
jgi:hypothetical protein